jgi:hypothetical protein
MGALSQVPIAISIGSTGGFDLLNADSELIYRTILNYLFNVLKRASRSPMRINLKSTTTH